MSSDGAQDVFQVRHQGSQVALRDGAIEVSPDWAAHLEQEDMANPIVHVFEIYPIRHQGTAAQVELGMLPQLWQWRLRYGRKTMAVGVEKGPGGRHGYASKRGAFVGLKATGEAFGLLMSWSEFLLQTSRTGEYIPPLHRPHGLKGDEMRAPVKVVIKAAGGTG